MCQACGASGVDPILAYRVGIRVAAKALDAAKAQGESAISLLRAAADLQQEIALPREPGRGEHLDVLA
jgi:hypothetical protein